MSSLKPSDQLRIDIVAVPDVHGWSAKAVAQILRDLFFGPLSPVLPRSLLATSTEPCALRTLELEPRTQIALMQAKARRQGMTNAI